MAPLVSLLALFALLSAVVASPHLSRHVHDHPHRAIAHPHIDLHRRDPVPLPKRKRALNKRCIPRPANASSSALPTSTLPINIAPAPSLQSYPPSSSSSSPPATSPTSEPPAPSPTTSDTPAPSPTTSDTPAPPPPTTSSTPPPAQTSAASSTSFMSGVQYGQGTYYSTGLGACGITNNDSQDIVAVGWQLFDNYPGYNGNPNDNPVCNKQIKATYQGKSVVVTVTDRCTGCSQTDLDMSPNAFNQLADPSIGRIDLSWSWVS